MNCPVCNIKLLMTERFGDYCAQCGGIWIETENSDKIDGRTFIEISTEILIENHDCHYDGRDDRGHDKPHGDHYTKHRKNRGFLH